MERAKGVYDQLMRAVMHAPPPLIPWHSHRQRRPHTQQHRDEEEEEEPRGVPFACVLLWHACILGPPSSSLFFRGRVVWCPT